MWELDVKLTADGVFVTVHKGPSCDAMKSKARKVHRDSENNSYVVEYRIYAQNGEQLYQVSSRNDYSRMKWSWGNFKPRSEQNAQVKGRCFGTKT